MNLQQELAALRKRIDELEAQAKTEATDSWPKNGSEYYYIATDATVEYFVFDGTNFDIDVVAIGNVYRTLEEANREVERRKVLTELRKLAKASWGGGNADWSRSGQYKWELFYDHKEKEWIALDLCWLSQTQGAVYFATGHDADAAIETIGADRLMLLLED